METTRNNTKITGYLEKKGKNKMIGSYKKYWFVLEGGLLLYYRSKIDYDTISPFKGCINLGPPCTIKPLISTAGAFQIQTRTSTITLRAPTQEEQNQWMQAIMSEINPTKNPQKMSHFRHTLNQFPKTDEGTEPFTNRAVSLEEPLQTDHLNESIIQRLQKIGGQSYGNSVISTISKAATRRAETKQIPQEFIRRSSDDLRNLKDNSETTVTSRDSRSSEHIYAQIPPELPSISHYDKPTSTKFQKIISPSRIMPNTFRVEPNQNLSIKFVAENDTNKCIIQKETLNQNISEKSVKKGTAFLLDEHKQTCNINENEAYALPVRNDFPESTTKADRKSTESNENIEILISVNNNERSQSNKRKNSTEKSSPTDKSCFFNNNKHSVNGNEIRGLEHSQEKQKAAATKSSHGNANAHENILIENDLYAHTLRYKEANKTPTWNNTFFPNKTPKYLCNIEEQEEKSVSLDNTDENKRSTLIHENEIYSPTTITSDHCSIRNDLYSLPVKEKKSNIDDGASFFIDNEHYLDNIYSEVDATRDYKENDGEKNSQENLYSIPDFPEIEEVEKKTANETEYAEPQYIEEHKCRSKLGFIIKKLSKKETDVEGSKNNSKLKKRNSFIRRVWKRKVKPKEKTDDEFIEENLYDTVAELVIEKLAVTDGNTLKMLSELQNILEMKKPILIEKLSEPANSPTSSVETKSIPETNDDNRSPELYSVVQNNEPSGSPLPILTPKTAKLENPSPFHDIPKNNKPVLLPPKKNKQYENIDEILDELDSQNNNRNKVKSLIKRFSETDVFDSEVELRTNRNTRESIDSDELSRLLAELAEVTNAPILTPGATSSLNASNIGNVEFSKLLPERRRRHSEPDYDIPRPHISLTILPKKEENSDVIESTRFFGPILKPCDMAVYNNRASSEAHFRLSSITPDSLEGNVPQRTPTPQNSTNEDDANCESHQYYKFMDRKTFLKNQNMIENSQKKWSSSSMNSDMMIENDIYVDPKSIRFNLKKREDVLAHNCEHDVEEDEVFIDSLENDNGGGTESTAL